LSYNKAESGSSLVKNIVLPYKARLTKPKLQVSEQKPQEILASPGKKKRSLTKLRIKASKPIPWRKQLRLRIRNVDEIRMISIQVSSFSYAKADEGCWMRVGSDRKGYYWNWEWERWDFNDYDTKPHQERPSRRQMRFLI